MAETADATTNSTSTEDDQASQFTQLLVSPLLLRSFKQPVFGDPRKVDDQYTSYCICIGIPCISDQMAKQGFDHDL